MNQADIKSAIEAQGLTANFNVSTYCPGDGTETTYTSVLAVQGHGKQRKRYRLGQLTKLSQLSEADLVALIETKTAKSAQVAQKGKE